jgi:hypothetical protein
MGFKVKGTLGQKKFGRAHALRLTVLVIRWNFLLTFCCFQNI